MGRRSYPSLRCSSILTVFVCIKVLDQKFSPTKSTYASKGFHPLDGTTHFRDPAFCRAGLSLPTPPYLQARWLCSFHSTDFLPNKGRQGGNGSQTGRLNPPDLFNPHLQGNRAVCSPSPAPSRWVDVLTRLSDALRFGSVSFVSRFWIRDSPRPSQLSPPKDFTLSMAPLIFAIQLFAGQVFRSRLHPTFKHAGFVRYTPLTFYPTSSGREWLTNGPSKPS